MRFKALPRNGNKYTNGYESKANKHEYILISDNSCAICVNLCVLVRSIVDLVSILEGGEKNEEANILYFIMCTCAYVGC